MTDKGFFFGGKVKRKRFLFLGGLAAWASIRYFLVVSYRVGICWCAYIPALEGIFWDLEDKRLEIWNLGDHSPGPCCDMPTVALDMHSYMERDATRSRAYVLRTEYWQTAQPLFPFACLPLQATPQRNPLTLLLNPGTLHTVYPPPPLFLTASSPSPTSLTHCSLTKLETSFGDRIWKIPHPIGTRSRGRPRGLRESCAVASIVHD